eukprot:Gb_29619 [translate_table: standard]
MSLRMTRKSKGARKICAIDPVVDTPTGVVAKKPKVESKTGKGGGGMKYHQKKKCRKKSGGESYKNFIYKVLKQVHPSTGISNMAMSIMNSFLNDTFEKLAREASSIARYNKMQTLYSWEFQIAIKLILPRELTNAMNASPHPNQHSTEFFIVQNVLCLPGSAGSNPIALQFLLQGFSFLMTTWKPLIFPIKM